MFPLIVITLVVLAAIAAVVKQKLTAGGGIAGCLVAIMIYSGAGNKGLIMLATFFLLAVWATKHEKAYKETLKGTPAHSQQRDAWQVLANGGVAAIFGLMAFMHLLYPTQLVVALAASLAAATADTLSSELGTVYGKRFYNVLSFKRDQRGLDGVVSLEGTLIGAAGAAVIALVYGCFRPRLRETVIIFVGGILGNYFDSLLGAALERKGWIKNDMVNFLTTFIAAVAAFGLIML